MRWGGCGGFMWDLKEIKESKKSDRIDIGWDEGSAGWGTSVSIYHQFWRKDGYPR